MDNEKIRGRIFELREEGYKNFSKALIPGKENILGVRIPLLRAFARELAKGDWRTYLNEAWDDYFEETMLQCMVVGYVKAKTREDFLELLEYFDRVVRKVDNWSFNDSLCSGFKITKKYKTEMWDYLMRLRSSKEEYEQRVLIIMLMNYYLDEEYIDRVLEIYNELKHDGYYQKMGLAWGIATAYAKFPEKTHDFLMDNNLEDFTYNKAIQKMLESYRISDTDKAELRKMKRR